MMTVTKEINQSLDPLWSELDVYIYGHWSDCSLILTSAVVASYWSRKRSSCHPMVNQTVVMYKYVIFDLCLGI